MTSFKAVCAVIFGALFANVHGYSIYFADTTGQVFLNGTGTESGLNIEIIRGNDIKLVGTIGVGRCFLNHSCLIESKFGDDMFIGIKPVENGFNITWFSTNTSNVLEDCVDLQADSVNWYGGPERYNQIWPIQKMKIPGDEPYILKRSDNFAIAERYWLNSKGAYIFVEDIVPLFVDQNDRNEGKVCFTAKAEAPYINRERVILTYYIIALENPKEAHLNAVNTYLGKPSGHPNSKMVAEPIWTTWAKYKKPISDEVVLAFADDIRKHNYTNGQLEIDDDWEVCYGSQVFKNQEFQNITNTVKALKEKNFRVTLWIHPFVNGDCQNNSEEGVAKGYFVRNTANSTKASWWDGDDAHQIDFTNPEAGEWWSSRLITLQKEHGIDSFKFDAGETDYASQPSVYDDVELTPNILSKRYIETCTKFGDLIEVRSSWRTQHLNHFIRMIDKDSNWGLSNGLATLITTLLQMNMNGYSMVLPDMIGGNGYGGQSPSGELIVRWTQANTFMPSMQFSYLPWDFKDEVNFDIEGIVKKYVDIHYNVAPQIIKAMERNVKSGVPVNPPIWWIDPTDPVALAVNDEYLLGQDILVAPIIEEGATSRNIYLPKGIWRDAQNGSYYEGPLTLNNYDAPIDVLPYFFKELQIDSKIDVKYV